MINISVISQNQKTIDIIDISNYSVISTNNSNQTAMLGYNNYILDIHTSSSSFTSANFWNNLTSISNDYRLAVIGLILIMMVYFIIYIAKKFSE